MSQNANESIQEKYDDWLAHPVTVALNHFLRREAENLRQQWSQGNFTSDTADKTALLNANAIGQAEVLDRILTLKPDELFLDQDK